MTAGPEPAHIVLIAVDDTGIHLYRDVKNALHSRGPGRRGVPVDCFDSLGFRLAPTFDDTWQLTGLTRTVDPPAPDYVLARLRAALVHVVQLTPQQETALARLGISAEEAKSQIPDVTRMTLPEAVNTLFTIFGHTTSNVGTPIHNIFAHGDF
jgi:hypothetical protein